MKANALPLVLALLAAAAAVHGATEDLSTGFLPSNWVTARLSKTLAGRGRFVMLTPNGPVRIMAQPEAIATARTDLAALQHSPATVSLDLSFIAYADKTEMRPAPQPPEVIDGIPAPRRFTAPRITAMPGGGAIAVPSQPIFSHRAAAVPAGQADGIPATTRSTRILRRLTFSGVLGQPLSIPLTPRAADPAGLRGLALKLEAIPAAEPAWTAAATELHVQSELKDGTLVLNVTPQVVLPARAGEEARRVPLTASSAGIPITHGAPAPVGTLPRTDADFYRLVLGTAPAETGAITALKLTATVNYIGSPPP